MSMTKVNFIYKDKKIEFDFTKNDLIKTVLSKFSTANKKNIDDFNYLYCGEKITNYEYKKLSELNDKDDIINISAYDKEINENSDNKINPGTNLKISEHIICPKCKNMSEIEINNFKISIKNCNNNHSMPGLYMNDFINTQFIEEKDLACNECKKTEEELLKLNNKKNKILLCSCGIIVCQSCYELHKENINKHYSTEYENKDFFCFEHNNMYTSFCQKCKKNICNKCESQHNKHRIDLFDKISPNEAFVNKIKELNENLIKKVKKFNNELNELINLLNNISTNIQNDLKIFLQISNKAINDYNLTKKNYQTIQNIKVIFNNMNDSAIIKNIDDFLAQNNSYGKIKCIIDIYTKMYLETKNNNIFINEFVKDNKDKINSNIQKNNNEKDKQDEKILGHEENKIILKKTNYNNYMILKYTPNLKKIKDNKIKLFGKKFFENNKNNCSMTINNSEYPISEYYTLKKGDLKNNEFVFKLNQINPLITMSNMFHSDADEPTIYLSEIKLINNWDISNVTDISYLFSNCTFIKTLPDISNWDTSNITNISNLFYHCINLTSIPDISNWNLDKVINMSYMFYDCKSITSLPDISKWNTKNASDMRGIFCNCSLLKTLPDISTWSTDNVTNMSGLFQHCSNLENLPDISKWGVGNVTNMGGMFDHCTSLETLPDISKWDMKNVNHINYMFYFCNKLNSFPDISIWNTENVKNMKGLFCDCSSVSILPDISKWNTSKVTNMGFMFYNCKSLLSLPDLVQWDTNKVEDIKNMFTNCNKLPKQIIPRKFKI